MKNTRLCSAEWKILIEFTSFVYRCDISNSVNSRILNSNISFHGSPLPRFESVSADKISLAFLLSTRGPIESILQQIRVTKARESRCVTFSPLNGTPIDKYSFLAHTIPTWTNNNNKWTNNSTILNSFDRKLIKEYNCWITRLQSISIYAQSISEKYLRLPRKTMFLNRREANLYFNLDELFITSRRFINWAYNNLCMIKK